MEWLVLLGLSGLATWYYRRHNSAQAAPEVGPVPGSMTSNLTPNAFVPIPGGGVSIAPASRAMLVGMMQAAGTIIVSVNMTNGVTFVGPPGTPFDQATGGGLALDTFRDTATNEDIWVSTLIALPADIAEVVTTAGTPPIQAANEPPVAKTPTEAANLSKPTMVRFSKAGETF